MSEAIKTLRLGIAGYGVLGKRRHAFIDLHPAMKAAAFCDRPYARAGQFENCARRHPQRLQE